MADNVDRDNIYIYTTKPKCEIQKNKKIKNKNVRIEEDMLASGSGHL